MKVERLLRTLPDEGLLEEDRLFRMVKRYAPSEAELEDADLEFVTAARGKTYYDQLFQQGKTDGKK